MKIIVKSPHAKAGEPLLKFVHEKVGQLAQVSDRILEVRVTLKLGEGDIRENKICEIRGVISGNDLFAENEAGTFREATLKSLDAIKRQLLDLKGQQSHSRGGTPAE
jgi:putative sigma-54 modulation protein